METALREIRRTTLSRVLQTPIARNILHGDTRREQYAAYLLDVYNYAQHSPKVIALAGARCASTHPQLAAYLFRHASEELGHEKWALADLQSLGLDAAQITAARPSASCAAIIGLEYFTAAFANPVGLFGWLYALESLGDDVAHAIAGKLTERLPETGGVAVHFLRGHGDSDHEHAKEITDHVLRYVTSASDRDDVLCVARLSAEYYVRLLCEAGEQGAK